MSSLSSFHFLIRQKNVKPTNANETAKNYKKIILLNLKNTSKEKPIKIGRAVDNKIQLLSSEISRNHSEIYLSRSSEKHESSIIIKDLSNNGGTCIIFKDQKSKNFKKIWLFLG